MSHSGGTRKETRQRPSPSLRVLVCLPTLATLMQQASIHWEQRNQALRAEEEDLTRLQHRLKALQQILALDTALPPHHCPALGAKIQALASQQERLRERITQERVRCQMLEQVFADAQVAQSVLFKQREQAHHRGRRQLQQVLWEVLAQVQSISGWW